MGDAPCRHCIMSSYLRESEDLSALHSWELLTATGVPICTTYHGGQGCSSNHLHFLRSALTTCIALARDRLQLITSLHEGVRGRCLQPCCAVGVFCRRGFRFSTAIGPVGTSKSLTPNCCLLSCSSMYSPWSGTICSLHCIGPHRML